MKNGGCVNESLGRDRGFQAARLELEVTERLCELMEQQDVSRAELARRIGVSPPYITKVLRGSTNLTLNTLSDLFFALGRSVRIVARPVEVGTPHLLVMEITQPKEVSSATREYRYNSPSTKHTADTASAVGAKSLSLIGAA